MTDHCVDVCQLYTPTGTRCLLGAIPKYFSKL